MRRGEPDELGADRGQREMTRLAALAAVALAAGPAAGRADPAAAEEGAGALAAEVRRAGETYPERGLSFHPAGPGEGKDRWAIGGVWQIAPMFTASYSRGLGSGFALDARLQTIVMYSQLGVGAAWGARAGPFHLGAMLHVSGFFGALGKVLVQDSGFDSLAWGLLIDPGVKAGLQVAGDSWLTLQLEAYFSPYQATKLGTLVISPESRLYEGFGTSLIVEHAPAREGAVYYGASLYHTRTNYPLWVNVETSGSSDAVTPRMIWYLGFLAGYEF